MRNSQLPTKEDLTLANYRIDIRYDGQNYFGWQRHKDKPTIQGAIENAVEECFGIRCNVEGSGRTDRGTHALGQVASIRLPEDLDVEEAKINLNNILGSSIEILCVRKVSEDFHARSSAIAKLYNYKIWNHVELPSDMQGKVWHLSEKLDVASMQNACQYFVGTMDYASFAKVPNFKQASTIRTVHSLTLVQNESSLCFSIIGEGFLYKMVRNIVRALVKVGEGRTPIEDLPGIIKAGNRKAAPGTAPACGLYLNTVFYDKKSMNAAIKKREESL